MDKKDFVFRLEIVVPEFVPMDFVVEKISDAKKQKQSIKRIQDVRLDVINDQTVCSMLYIGPYDDEPISFEKIQEHINESGNMRISKNHREIYLGDVRRARPDKLRTILEVLVDKK